MEHGAFFDLDFLLASCLLDVQKKEELAKSVTSFEFREETLFENTYDKDDQISSALQQIEVKPEPPLKKKRGRKKKVKAPAPEISDQPLLSDVSGAETGEESSYSDLETSDAMDVSSSSLGGEGRSVEESLLTEVGEGGKERFVCQAEGCGKSYNTKGNRMTHEKKAHGILGPRAAKRQRMSLAQEDTVPTLPDEEDKSSQLDSQAPVSSSFLTDTSLDLEDAFDDMKGEEDTFHGEEKKVVGEVDFSSSQYFKNNPKMMSTARESSISLFDQINPSLPPGWRLRVLTVISKTGDKATNRHYLSPEMKVLKSGMAVVEYLRLQGEFNIDQLKVLAKDLNIADKKFQSLFSVWDISPNSQFYTFWRRSDYMKYRK